jgi:hypothetical protein
MKKRKVKSRGRGSSEKVKRSKKISDLEVLDMMFDKFVKQLKRSRIRIGVKEALKIIALRQKLRPKDEADKEFWDFIDKLRKEELPKLYPEEEVRGGNVLHERGDHEGFV